jgi:hypothetical protein
MLKGWITYTMQLTVNKSFDLKTLYGDTARAIQHFSGTKRGSFLKKSGAAVWKQSTPKADGVCPQRAFELNLNGIEIKSRD